MRRSEDLLTPLFGGEALATISSTGGHSGCDHGSSPRPHILSSAHAIVTDAIATPNRRAVAEAHPDVPRQFAGPGTHVTNATHHLRLPHFAASSVHTAGTGRRPGHTSHCVPGPVGPMSPGSVVAVPEATRPDALHRPHPQRFGPHQFGYEAALRAHDRAVAVSEAGYLDPSSGLFVMTAAHLIARGSCCNSGCRHCPYVGATSAASGNSDEPPEPR